jgi:hypothetical protein
VPINSSNKKSEPAQAKEAKRPQCKCNSEVFKRHMRLEKFVASSPLHKIVPI